MKDKSHLPEGNQADLIKNISLIGSILITLIDAAAEAVREVAPKIVLLIESVKRMPSIFQSALIELANQGWYLDWYGMSLQEPAELAEAYLEGKHQDVENRLIEHYKNRLASIEEELTVLLPSRSAVLHQAFEAHRQGLYFAAIPTFLAQADGICKELSGEYFFMNSRGKKGQRFTQLSEQEILTKALLSPFFDTTSIRLSHDQRPSGFDKLNRHLILHGESLDYGTELKSLQSISFLNYVAISLNATLEHNRRLTSEPPS